MMSACVRLGRPTIIVRIEKHYYCSDNYHNCRIGKINSLGCSGQPISNNAHLMEESTAPMMEYCILFLDPLRIVWLHGAWQTPCPMPTKCPGETAFKTSQSTLALLFLTRFSSCKYLKNQKKNHLHGFKEIRTTDPTTLSHTMHCNAQYRDHVSWDHRWHWVRIKSHTYHNITYGTSRMLIVSFTSQIFTMENVLVKINSIPQTLHIPILHYSLIIRAELHAAASTCCQTVVCVECTDLSVPMPCAVVSTCTC